MSNATKGTFKDPGVGGVPRRVRPSRPTHRTAKRGAIQAPTEISATGFQPPPVHAGHPSPTSLGFRRRAGDAQPRGGALASPASGVFASLSLPCCGWSREG
jgi:hypothetical protein